MYLLDYPPSEKKCIYIICSLHDQELTESSDSTQMRKLPYSLPISLKTCPVLHSFAQLTKGDVDSFQSLLNILNKAQKLVLAP